MRIETEQFVQRCLVAVQIGDEGLQAAVVDESLILAGALVRQPDTDAGIEEGQFTQPFGQDIVVEFDVAERIPGRFEIALGAGFIRFADSFQRFLRFPVRIGLFENIAVAPNGEPEFAGKGIDYRHAHAVQTTGYLVAVVVEFAAGMQGGHDDLGGRDAFVRMDIHRDAAAVVQDGHRLTRVNNDLYVIAITRQRLIDGVVYQFLHHVVQARAIIGIADIHARPLANRVKSTQYLDVA